jgi:two-component system nitrogen regulation response regulator NtrX
VGHSPELEKVRELVARVAPTNARVLITGENGSGKELVARAIHDGSARSREPFVEVNCAAIPSELIESELFGHVKGAFTGATGEQAGKFDAADRGTLFLDEIGDLALNAQAKILRALQEGVIMRVGDSHPIVVDVRVIAATNRDLAGEIAAGRFREDLFFRLNVMPIAVPPLRDRARDIPDLVAHFVKALGSGPGMTRKGFDRAALQMLQRRRWPGNVRELRNAVERLLILSTGAEVTADDVATALPFEERSLVDLQTMASEPGNRTLLEFRDDAEKAYITAQLQMHRWNITETARTLGVQRSVLYDKIERFAIAKGESHDRTA